MYHKWRAPKKDNDGAWARIQTGDYLWERPKNYTGQPGWVGDRLTLAKKKPAGFGRYWPENVRKAVAINRRDRIKEAILERMGQHNVLLSGVSEEE